MNIKPVDPRDQQTRTATEHAKQAAPRRTLGLRGPSRRTLGKMSG